MKILVTGFDPFGGEKINPAIESVKKLPDEIAGAKIIKLEIPTVCHQSLKVIDEAIAKYDPDVILSIGQAGCVVNSVLSWIGALGAIYTLGTNDAKTLHNDKVLKIDGTSF